MGNNSKLTTFTLASDYDPIHYEWTVQELAVLGDCRATAEVIKRRLEYNGAKVKEMYAIEHKGEKKATKVFHKGTDETKTHYHILVKFEPSHGATLEEIAKYLGIPTEIIEKLKQGRYSYDNVLAYLTHIKYKDKIQYAPEDVVTLAVTDYMDYFNEHKERWIKARDIVTKKGGKTLDRRFLEAISKLKSGELLCKELSGMPEYRPLFFTKKYRRELEETEKAVEKLAYFDKERLRDKYQSGEISMEEARASEEYKIVFKYYKDLRF